MRKNGEGVSPEIVEEVEAVRAVEIVIDGSEAAEIGAN